MKNVKNKRNGKEMRPPTLPTVEVPAGSSMTFTIHGPAKIYGWRVLQLDGGSVYIQVDTTPGTAVQVDPALLTDVDP